MNTTFNRLAIGSVMAFGILGIEGAAKAEFTSPVLWSPSYGYADGWLADSRVLADVDGDDRDDVVGFGDDGVYVSLSTGTGFAKPSLWVANYGSSDDVGGWRTGLHPRFLAEVDGDARKDIVGFGDDGVYVSLSTGEGFAAPEPWVDAYGITNGWQEEKHPRVLADADGDGRDDVIGFGDDGVYVSLSTGTAFTEPTRWIANYGQNDSTGSWRAERHLRFLAEVNGDGRKDIVGFGDDGVYVSLSTGEGFAAPEPWVDAYGVTNGWQQEKHPRVLADADGDGRDDVIGFGDDGVYVSRSTGTAFTEPELWIADYGSDDTAGG